MKTVVQAATGTGTVEKVGAKETLRAFDAWTGNALTVERPHRSFVPICDWTDWWAPLESQLARSCQDILLVEYQFVVNDTDGRLRSYL